MAYRTRINRWIAKGRRLGYKFDGCTGVPDLNIRSCCDRHDFDYQNLTKTRWQADAKFGRCMLYKARTGPIHKRVWAVLVAATYWTGVRLFGHFYWRKKQNQTLGKILQNVDGPVGSERL
jgi:Prokaryotic phospholipase A2.